ncbi:sugar phosphate isomerase/epimerase [Rhodopirellula rubra]|uniref:Sugar phosphate isomerase/epimerase n=1 Tax=Aporhodopirellula rubra TaxID=980271 RepID=A0A7W5DX92_9BACT|nr:sugar phosphate isomerase/epimerase family protein [Aporhodopirellula rubra]MBB3206120.1 sugar phosphate isomerase/epimerase [Aporhodopirellula rubra]
MHFTPRRRFLQAAVATSLITSTTPSFGLDRFHRINPRIKGISLSAFSMRPHMRWWKGSRTDANLDLVGFLEYCAELGLDGAEMTSYFFPDPLDRSYVNQLKRRAHLLGIDITGGAMGNNFANAPGSESTRKEMEYFRSWIDHFADLGAPAVRIFASRGKPKNTDAQQITANVIANLEQALPYAEKRGVMLGLENHDIMTNVDDLIRVVDNFESPWLGVTWDSANLAPTPDPYAELAKIAPYAITAQLKVMTHINGEPAPADLPRMLAILTDAQFGGYVVLEYEEKEDPYAAIPKFVGEVRNALSTIN